MLSRPLTLMIALSALAAGCVNAPADDAQTAATELPTDAVALPQTEEVAGDIQISAASPARTVNYGGAFTTVIELKDNITGFVLELEWDAATPFSESLSMWVRPAGAGAIGVPPDPSLVTGTAPPLAKVDGASPLRVALAADAFPEPGEYDVVVRATGQPVGVALGQSFTMHVTRFDGIAFDEAFSALGAAEEDAD